MTIHYKHHRILDPTISTLADGTGYTVFNVDIAREVGTATEVKSIWVAGKFSTREAARNAAIASAVRFINNQ